MAAKNYQAMYSHSMHMPQWTLTLHAYTLDDALPFTLNLTMLYLIGLGLCDPSDITVKGLEAVKKASRVYLEAYTSILIASSKEELVSMHIIIEEC